MTKTVTRQPRKAQLTQDETILLLALVEAAVRTYEEPELQEEKDNQDMLAVLRRVQGKLEGAK